MLGKYLVSGQEGGWGWPSPGSRFCCGLFFFFFLLLSSFSWLRLSLPQTRALATSQEGDTGLSNPPAARVEDAGCHPPQRGGGQLPGPPWPQGPCPLLPSQRHVESCTEGAGRGPGAGWSARGVATAAAAVAWGQSRGPEPGWGLQVISWGECEQSSPLLGGCGWQGAQGVLASHPPPWAPASGRSWGGGAGRRHWSPQGSFPAWH